MNLALDCFSRSLYQESLLHLNTCRDCDRAIPEGRKYCTECAEINWSEEIAGMKLDQFSQKLRDVFDGELRDFDILDGEVQFIYLSTDQGRLDLARRMLGAYGANCSMGENSIMFSLGLKRHGYGSAEMELV